MCVQAPWHLRQELRSLDQLRERTRCKRQPLLPASDPSCRGDGPAPLPPPPPGVWHNVSGARGSHLDIKVTFHGLSKLSPADRTKFAPAVRVFAPLGQPISWSSNVGGGGGTGGGGGIGGESSTGTSRSASAAGWINGTLNSGGSRAPLALRLGQDNLTVRVLVDATATETFWVRFGHAVPCLAAEG